jgi:hypothetical protein
MVRSELAKEMQHWDGKADSLGKMSGTKLRISICSKIDGGIADNYLRA